MPIFTDVSEQMKVAMRAKDADRLRGLRNIRAAFIETMKQDGSTDLSDEACITVLRRLAKQRKDSIQSYQAGGRDDLVADEVSELAVVESFLPAGPDEATVRDWVAAAIEATGATEPKHMGKVMGRVMGAHRGEVDGNTVKAIALELLKG